MDEKSLDPVDLKKKLLLPHLDFVETMLVKVKGTPLEEKWKIMHECIVSDKKRPSYEKIKQIEKTLISLKSQSKQKINAGSTSHDTSQKGLNSESALVSSESFESGPTGSYSSNEKPSYSDAVSNKRRSLDIPENRQSKEDDVYFRKRSQSPSASKESNLITKRRYSCYATANNEKQSRDPRIYRKIASESENNMHKDNQAESRKSTDSLPILVKRNKTDINQSKNISDDSGILGATKFLQTYKIPKRNESKIGENWKFKSSKPNNPLAVAIKKIDTLSYIKTIPSSSSKIQFKTLRDENSVKSQKSGNTEDNKRASSSKTLEKLQDKNEEKSSKINQDVNTKTTVPKSGPTETVKSEVIKSKEPIIEKKSTEDDQKLKDEVNSSASSKAGNTSQTANILTSLLENDDENPEKILEGLMSVLGAEKLKKMQELLLKKTLNIGDKTDGENSNDAKKNPEKIEDKPTEALVIKEEIIEQEIDEMETETDRNSSIMTSSEQISKTLNSGNESEKFSPEKQQYEELQNSQTDLDSSNKKPASKRRRKKLSELDRLHQDILSSNDCEGILRACTQPRVVIKPKLFESPVTPAKKSDTIPLSVSLLRLELNPKDMPVILNDEFFATHKLLSELKSKPAPRSKKIYYSSALEIKEEPVETPVAEESETNMEQDYNFELPKPKETVSVISKSERLDKKKKKRKGLLWSKGILKKRTKRLRLLGISEWQDIEKSDENQDCAVLKLRKFKDMFNEFALKCGFDKGPKRLISMTDSLLKESDKTEEISKRINLPMEKNLLSVIPKADSKQYIIENEVQKKQEIKITAASQLIKLPYKSPVSFAQPLPTLNQEMSQSQKLMDPKPNTLPMQSNSQKVGMVKPTAREIPENIVVRSLSVQEQEALKNALSTSTKAIPIGSLQKKVIDISKLTNANPNLSITKIQVQKNVQKSAETLASPASSSNIQRSYSTSPNIVKPASNVQKVVGKVSNIVHVPSPNNMGIVQRPHPTPTLYKSSTSERRPYSVIEEIITKPKPVIKISSLVEAIQNRKKKIEDPNKKAESTDKKDETNEASTESAQLEKDKLNSLVEEKCAEKGSTTVLEILPAIESKSDCVNLIDEEDEIIDLLRPWIERPEFKSKKGTSECIKMIDNMNCLAALFKCMGSTCSYFTNDIELFQLHLELHRDNQNNDFNNFLLCPYCNFRPNSINLLVTHISTAHGYAKYGCKYCFYRSVNEYQVTANHHTNFHRSKEKCVIVFEPKKFKNENTEKVYISETIPKVCPALPCPYCRTGFYTTAEFETHVKSHKENYTTICKKCEQATNRQNILYHLLKCFDKFGNYQCVFCVFGTSNFAAIDNHLSTLHSDKMSYFAERTLNHGKDPTSIEALTIKELSKKITANVRKIILSYPFSDEIFRNADNVGKLSEDLIFHEKHGEKGTFVRIIKKSAGTTSSPVVAKKSSLQIGQVRSLHD